MRSIVNQTFVLEDYEDVVASDLSFVNCTFRSCKVSVRAQAPEQMARIRNVEFVDCYDLNSIIGPCRLEQVRIENLKTANFMLVWGALLTQVTLSGKIGSLKFNDNISSSHADDSVRTLFRDLRRAHYEEVDWALDISNARPLTLEVHGIPASKIRINPDIQVIVSKNVLHSEDQLRGLAGLDEVTGFSLSSFIAGDAVDRVLVAPTGRSSRYYKPVLNSFAALRRAGLAAPS